MEDKKAVLGLDTAKLFILAILTLVIVSVVVLIVLNSLGEIQPDVYGGALANATTLTVVNVTGGVYPTGLSSANEDCTISVSVMTNASSGDIIPSTNYTITDCTIGCTSVGACDLFNNSLWNVSGTYTKTSDSKYIVINSSSAVSDFFEEVGTWFTLLSVVIIILIISVVIVVINNFGGGNAFSRNTQAPNI